MLSLAISGLLYERLSRQHEGELAHPRQPGQGGHARAHRRHAGRLGRAAPGRGRARTGGQRPSILADVVEALIGAVYLDAGFAEAEAWCAGSTKAWTSTRP